MLNTYDPNQVPMFSQGQGMQRPVPPMFAQGQGMGPPGQPGQPMPPMQPPTSAMGAPGAGAGGGVSPEFLKMIMDTHGMSQEAQRIERQRKIADMLRAGASDQLRGVQVGRMYAAPTGLNLAANLFSQYAGSRADTAADEASGALGRREGDAAAEYFRRLTSGGRRG